jgi:hypothetical protein
MSSDKPKAAKGEMRKRHEAIVRSGALASVRSEGRLVFVIALVWADYKTCEFTMSSHGAAEVAGVQRTSIRRGIEQLMEAGILRRGPKRQNRHRYRFIVPSNGDGHSGCQLPGTSGASCLAPGVPVPGTGCASSLAPGVPPIPQCSSRVPSRNPQGTGNAIGLEAAVVSDSRQLEEEAKR